MDFYSILVSVLRRFLGIFLSWCVAVETPKPPFTPPDCPPHPKPPKAKLQTTRAHAPTQLPTHPKIMATEAVENDHNSAWTSDSTASGHNILAEMGWKEGAGLGKSQ